LLTQAEEQEREQQLLSIRRRGELEIGNYEHMRIRKENNAKDILNQVMHTKITGKLRSKESEIEKIEQKLKEMSFSPQ
jgi:hypothetical protein